MVTILRDDGAEIYETKGGISVTRQRRPIPYADAVVSYVEKLDERRGAVFSSNYEYPGRYTRWDTAVVDPPLGISSFGRDVWIEAYNERGEVLLGFVTERLKTVRELELGASTARRLDLKVKLPDRVFTEEERSKMPTVFTVLFEVVSAYGTVGLSFGYPGVNTSFSGQFNVVSKLVIIAMQIRGRHRGLPYALDRAVLLPSDALNRHEAEESERRMRRRASNLSGGESVGRPRSRSYSMSQAQADGGLSTGLESHDWQTHPAPNGDNLVHRSSTVRSNR